jgi:hypothetical protein
MREHTDKLFGHASSCPTFPPAKVAPSDARASPSQPHHSSVGSSLRTVAPELFAEFVRRYSTLLDKAVEQRTHQGESISTALGDLSARLVGVLASARDVIELHAHALDAKLASVPPRWKEAYVEEGRFVVLELMGRLLSDYRAAFLQARQLFAPGSPHFALSEAHQGNEE